jgi:hypothetical protein
MLAYSRLIVAVVVISLSDFRPSFVSLPPQDSPASRHAAAPHPWPPAYIAHLSASRVAVAC